MYWNFSEYLDLSKTPSYYEKTYLIILNQPLPKNIKTLWKKAAFVIVSDGGANRLYNFFNDDEKSRNEFIPKIICGNLNTIPTTIQSYYSQKGTQIHPMDSMNETDLDKCLSRITEPSIVLACGLLGRFDYTMGCLHTLYRFEEHKVYLVSPGNLTILLKKGTNELFCDTKYEGKFIGLWPMNGSAKVITTGLKWNLGEDMPMSFDKFISSSNTFADDKEDVGKKVTVKTDLPLVWTIDLKE